MKNLIVSLEIIFVCCFVGLTLRFFGLKLAEELSTVFYAVGAVSFIFSIILRNHLKKKHSANI